MEIPDLAYRLEGQFTCVFFRTAAEIASAGEYLKKKGWLFFDIEASSTRDDKSLFLAFASVMHMPKGYYGEQEEYAPNANAFLEYFDDISEWLPATGHVYVMRSAGVLWREAPHIVGFLVELIQYSRLNRKSDARLVFDLGAEHA